jgi:hypothetical protein
VLHRHERRADAHDGVLGNRDEVVAGAVGVPVGNFDADLVDRSRIEPRVAELA